MSTLAMYGTWCNCCMRDAAHVLFAVVKLSVSSLLHEFIPFYPLPLLVLFCRWTPRWKLIRLRLPWTP
jgi:hypothetical protein